MCEDYVPLFPPPFGGSWIWAWQVATPLRMAVAVSAGSGWRQSRFPSFPLSPARGPRGHRRSRAEEESVISRTIGKGTSILSLIHYHW